MDRRTFCIFSSTALACVLMPTISYSEVNAALPVQLSQPAILTTISDTNMIAKLGNAYLGRVDSENTSSRLINALMTNTNGGAIPHTTDSLTLQRLVSEKIQYDFETGETVVINGWVLSKTEARQCALFSLSQQGS